MYVFISIYFILTFFILGNQISASLAKSSGDAVASFNAYMIWYLVADLLIRCILQPIPSLDVIPYFRFRIRRNKIINHLLVRSALIVISSHDLNHVTDICTRIAIIEKGAIIRDLKNDGGAMNELANYFSVRKQG